MVRMQQSTEVIRRNDQPCSLDNSMVVTDAGSYERIALSILS